MQYLQGGKFMSVNIVKYNETIDKINECINWFERLDIKNNRVDLYLGNGDILNIKFPESSIAHLLGINLSYLNMTNKFRKDAFSYDKLKYVLKEPYVFQKLLVSKTISMENMFSDSIDQKLSVFKDNLSVRIDDIYCVIKYDNEKTYQSINVPDVCDYYVIPTIMDSLSTKGVTHYKEMLYKYYNKLLHNKTIILFFRY